MKLPIYFDNHSTTQMDERVLEAMLPYFRERYGNPSSKEHVFGWTAEQAVNHSREIIARAISAQPSEIYFTSGTTESNNIAIQGLAESFAGYKNHIITTNIEHSSVLNTLAALEQKGIEVTYLPVNKQGLINPDILLGAITDKTFLVTIMTANNEIGTIMPIKEIGKICKERKIIFHTDAAQAIGKVPFNVNEDNVDMVSFSAHKIYGPKGTGALYIRKRIKNKITPLLRGGAQEDGIRSGTLNVPAIVGFGKAIEIMFNSMDEECQRIKELKEHLYEELVANLDGVYLNGHPEKRLHNNLNLTFEGIKIEILMMELRDFAFSAGSACSSGSGEPSHVLKALGLNETLIKNTIRFGLGRFTTKEEIDYTIERFIEAVTKIRNTANINL